MTTDVVIPFVSYTVAGTGPYTVNWPYQSGELNVYVQGAGVPQLLTPGTNWTVAPDGGEGGAVTLSAAIAATHAGAKLHIARATLQEQGFEGRGNREKGLEANLDRLMRAVQDLTARQQNTPWFPGVSMAPGSVAEGRSLIFQDGGVVPGPTATEVESAAAAAAAAIAAAGSAAEILAAVSGIADVITSSGGITITAIGDGERDYLEVAGNAWSKANVIAVFVGNVAQTPESWTLSNTGTHTRITFGEPIPTGLTAWAILLKQVSANISTEDQIVDLTTKSVPNRAAAVAWIAAHSTPPIGFVLQWDRGAVQYTGAGQHIPDMPGYVPFEKPTLSYDFVAYQPAITRVAVDVGSGLYRHVPSIAVKSTRHLVGVYLYNDTSPVESELQQITTFVRSMDNGATWSAKSDELNQSATATNPLTTNADLRLHTQCDVFYDHINDQEIALAAQRGGPVGANRGLISFRTATPTPTVEKWTNYCVRFNSATNAVELSSTDVTGNAAAAGFKLTYTLEGLEYDIVPFKPVIGNAGELVVPLVLARTFAVDMRVGFLVRQNGIWSMRGVIPLGEASAGDSFEPTLWQATDGTWYCQARALNKVGGASPDNHILSASTDLQSWTPWTFLDEDIHGNRQYHIKARDDLYLGVGTSQDNLRNNLALFASLDGHQWVHGATIGAETDGVDLTHYSDIAVLGNTVYVLYTEEEEFATSAAPNNVRFARFVAPTAAPIMGSAKNAYEFDSGTPPTVSGNILTLPPRQIGSVPISGKSQVLSIRARVTVAPGTTPYRIISVGDEALGYFTIEYRDNGGTTELWCNGVFIQNLVAPTQFRDFSVAIDMERGLVSALGQNRVIRRFARVYLGDTTVPATAQAGSIEYDASRFKLTTYLEGLPRQFVPQFPQIRGSDIRSVSETSDASIGVDTPSGFIGSFHHRVNGLLRAGRYWNDNLQKLFDQVLGVNAVEITDSLWRALVPASFTARATFSSFINVGTPTTLTIDAAGVITPTRTRHRVDTYQGGVSSDLVRIEPTSDGDIIILSPVATGRLIVVRHNLNNIFCGANITLNSLSDRITLECQGGSWFRLSHADN